MRTDAWNNWIQSVNMDIFPQTFRYIQYIFVCCDVGEYKYLKEHMILSPGRLQRIYSLSSERFVENIVLRKRFRYKIDHVRYSFAEDASMSSAIGTRGITFVAHRLMNQVRHPHVPDPRGIKFVTAMLATRHVLRHRSVRNRVYLATRL